MNETRDWQGETGESWAREYRRTDRSFGALTERLLAKTRDFSFVSTLDIGCGAGELSLAIARGRPRVRVMGVDISEPLIHVARDRGERLLNLEFQVADAAQFAPADDFRPELLISRHGVMFFGDPLGAFKHLAGIAAPGAGLLFSCFRSPAENELFSGLGALMPPPAASSDARTFDPHAPGPLAFADPEYVRSVLEPAGWGMIEFEPFDYAMVVGLGENPVADAVDYLLSTGPLAARRASFSGSERDELSGRLHDYLAAKEIDGIVALRAAAWLVTARCD